MEWIYYITALPFFDYFPYLLLVGALIYYFFVISPKLDELDDIKDSLCPKIEKIYKEIETIKNNLEKDDGSIMSILQEIIKELEEYRKDVERTLTLKTFEQLISSKSEGKGER